MAYIVDGRDMIAAKLSGDPGPDLETRAGVLKLARSGHAQSVKDWDLYAQLDPADARFVEACVAEGQISDRSESSAPELSQRALLAAWANDSDYDLARGARSALAALEAS